MQTACEALLGVTTHVAPALPHAPGTLGSHVSTHWRGPSATYSAG